MYLRRTTTGDPLVKTSEAADFLKVTQAEEHEFIASLVEAATLYAEGFCGRDLRENSYELLRTDFGERGQGNDPLQVRFLRVGFRPFTFGFIPIRRATVATVEDVSYLLSGTFTTIATSVYYTVLGLSEARLILNQGEAWPTDADDVEHNVRVQFTTLPIDNVSVARAGILRHVALMYADRGDAEPAQVGSSVSGATTALALNTARQSGAEGLYHMIQIPSV